MSLDRDRHGVWIVVGLLFQALVATLVELWWLGSWVASWFG